MTCKMLKNLGPRCTRPAAFVLAALAFPPAAALRPAGPSAATRFPAVFQIEPQGDGNFAAPQVDARCFRLGFTGFPHDFTLQAISEARRFVRENADLVAHHIEGVPWAEALHGKPFSRKLLDDWKGKVKATPRGGKIYLAVSPGRGNLKVTDKGLPLAPELRGKRYDDPLVKKAYLAYCRRCLEFFHPDYLVIGIEVNEILQAGEDRWRAYLELHKHVYRELKKTHEHLPVFASFTLHGMLNARGKTRERMLSAMYELMPFCDIVGVSFYPFIAGGTTDISGALKWLTDHFDRFKKPYAVVETGEAAQELTFPGSGQTIHGTPQKQEKYFKTLLALAQERCFEFVVCFIHRDYDALWEKIKASSPEAFMAWRDCGLVDENGTERPAFAVWKRYQALPFRR